MLQNIRDNIQGVAAKIIIGLMIVPFALYGIDFLFSGSSERPVAVVNGEDVSQFELDQALALQRRQLLAMMGDSIDPALLDDAVMRKPALDSLIKQKVLLQAADKAGLAVPDAVLNSAIMQMSQFHEDGRFSTERFQQVLSMQGFSPQLFRRLLRSDLLIEQLNSGVANSVFLGDFQREIAVRLGDQKRTFHYLLVDGGHFAARASVDETEVQQYYDENPEKFRNAEAVRIAYLELKTEDFYQPVEEADIRAAYEQEVDAIKRQTERRAAHILVEMDDRGRAEAEQRIEEARTQLAAGKSFADVAKTYSDDFGSAEQGGDLGYSAGNTFPESFEQALVDLSPGEVSGVIETDAGLHLVKLLEERSPEIADYEDRRDTIEERLQRQAAKPRLIAEVEALRDLVFNADGLRQPADSLNLELKRSDWLTADQRDGLMENASVRSAAFDAELRRQGYNSEVFELNPDHYLVLRPEDYKAPELKPLDAVREQIVSELKVRKGRDLAEAAAQRAVADLRADKSAEDIARELDGVEWQVAVRAWRQDPAVEPAILRHAFSLPRPGEEGPPAVSMLADANGDYIVVQLTSVFDGEDSVVGDKRRRELLVSTRRVWANQSFNAYFDSVVKSANVKIN